LQKKTADKKALGNKTLDKNLLNKKVLATETSRKPRADALRNRERVLEAARAVFSAGGPDAGLSCSRRAARSLLRSWSISWPQAVSPYARLTARCGARFYIC